MTNIIDLNLSQDDINPNLLQLFFGCLREAVIPEVKLGVLAPKQKWLREKLPDEYRLRRYAVFINELRARIQRAKLRIRWQTLTVADFMDLFPDAALNPEAETQSILIANINEQDDNVDVKMNDLINFTSRQWLESDELVRRYWSELDNPVDDIRILLECFAQFIDLPAGLLRPQDKLIINGRSLWNILLIKHLDEALSQHNLYLRDEVDFKALVEHLDDIDSLFAIGHEDYSETIFGFIKTHYSDLNLHYSVRFFASMLEQKDALPDENKQP